MSNGGLEGGGRRERGREGEREREEERREEGEVKYMSLDKPENGKKKIVSPIELWCLLSPDSSLLTLVLFTLFLSFFFVSVPSHLKPIQLELCH